MPLGWFCYADLATLFEAPVCNAISVPLASYTNGLLWYLQSLKNVFYHFKTALQFYYKTHLRRERMKDVVNTGALKFIWHQMNSVHLKKKSLLPFP